VTPKHRAQLAGDDDMAGIAYIMVGTNDMDRSLAFYDGVLGLIGARRRGQTPKGHIYHLGGGQMLMVTKPYDEGTASAGNGSMIAFAAESTEQVAALYAKALELGGSCEGAPGPRGSFGDFAYFRDPDGNKLCAACIARG
jgi:catechol 2,3-dioxygenase-like lactoylglutathione lyase family enzyme